VGYSIFLLALLVRDVLWLRIILTVASLCFVAFAWVIGAVGMQLWNVAFTTINIVHVLIILRERSHLHLTADLRLAYNDCFWHMTRREFVRLWTAGRPLRLDETKVCVQGVAPTELVYLLDGVARVERDGRHVVTLGKFNFIGEMSFLTESAASATVIVSGRAHGWTREQIAQLQQRSPILVDKLKISIGVDMSQKLEAA
jgi:hypothetical protein